MKKRTWLYGLAITLAALVCLQAGAGATLSKELILKNVRFQEGKAHLSAETDGYYQLIEDGQGSITFLNDGYAELKVSGYSRSASFSTVYGNQPMRGSGPLGFQSKNALPLRYDPARFLLLARDEREVFCVYPDHAARGSYALASTLGSFSVEDFSHLPFYGICLEYSKDGAHFQRLDYTPQYREAPQQVGSPCVYEERHLAAVPTGAIWLRITLSRAGWLSSLDGTLLPNQEEQPIAVSVVCSRADGTSIALTVKPPVLSDSLAASSAPVESSVSFLENSDSSAPQSASASSFSGFQTDGSGSLPGSDPPVSGGGHLSISPSSSAAEGKEREETPPRTVLSGRLEREPVYSESKVLPSASPNAPVSSSPSFNNGGKAHVGFTGSASEEKNPAEKAVGSEPIHKAAEKPEGSSVRKELPSDMAAEDFRSVQAVSKLMEVSSHTDPEIHSAFFGPLVLYLMGLSAVASFLAGQARGKRLASKSKSPKYEKNENKGELENEK